MTAATGATYSYYDPAVGRFLSRDPVPYLQRYAYAGNNPVIQPCGIDGDRC